MDSIPQWPRQAARIEAWKCEKPVCSQIQAPQRIPATVWLQFAAFLMAPCSGLLAYILWDGVFVSLGIAAQLFVGWGVCACRYSCSVEMSAH